MMISSLQNSAPTTRAALSLIFILALSSSCAQSGALDLSNGSGLSEVTDPGGGSSDSNMPASSGSDNNGAAAAPTPTPVPTTSAYKPEALAWESTSHPERTAWSTSLYSIVSAHFTDLDKATDISTFCSEYASLTKNQKINLWADVFAGTAYYESGWNPTSSSVDVGTAGDKDTWSVGLLQMSVVDQANYGFAFGYSFTDLQDAVKNLNLGVSVMAKQVAKRGIVLIPSGGSGLYWATLHPGGKYDETANIVKLTKKLSFCH